jgi:hypothetical protein
VFWLQNNVVKSPNPAVVPTRVYERQRRVLDVRDDAAVMHVLPDGVRVVHPQLPVTQGCHSRVSQIVYTDHAGSRQLVCGLQNNVVRSANPTVMRQRKVGDGEGVFVVLSPSVQWRRLNLKGTF